MSAVSAATNETTENVLFESPIEDTNNVSSENVSVGDVNDTLIIDNEDNSNYSYSGGSNEIPQLEMSIKSDDNGSANSYIDISIDYKDYSLDINNKNYFFTFNQNFKNNSIANPNNHGLLNLGAFAKKNGVFLNVNFLNISDKDIELYAPSNIFTYMWELFLSFLNSIF